MREPRSSRRHLIWLVLPVLLACAKGEPATVTDAEGGSGGAPAGAEDDTGDGAGGGGGDTAPPEVQPGGRGGDIGGAGGGAAEESPTGGAAGTSAPTPDKPAPVQPDCTGRTVCETFENIAVGQRPPLSLGTVKLSPASKLFVDDSKPYTGTRSLRVEGNPVGTNASEVLLNIPVGPLWKQGKTIYVRMMMFPETRGTGDGHWDVIQAHGQVDDSVKFGAMVSYGGFGAFRGKLLYVGKPLSWADCSLTSSRFIFGGRWECIEFKIDGNDPAAAYGVDLNGRALHELHVGTMPAKSNCVPTANGIKDHWYVPDIDAIAVGYNHVHAQLAPFRYWLDDLVIDDKPIGCPTP